MPVLWSNVAKALEAILQSTNSAKKQRFLQPQQAVINQLLSNS
jgi:hypothetical protein